MTFFLISWLLLFPLRAKAKCLWVFGVNVPESVKLSEDVFNDTSGLIRFTEQEYELGLMWIQLEHLAVCRNCSLKVSHFPGDFSKIQDIWSYTKTQGQWMRLFRRSPLPLSAFLLKEHPTKNKNLNRVIRWKLGCVPEGLFYILQTWFTE